MSNWDDVERAIRNRYYVEFMQNGLIRVLDRQSGLQGCYDRNTLEYRHGDLRRLPEAVLSPYRNL